MGDQLREAVAGGLLQRLQAAGRPSFAPEVLAASEADLSIRLLKHDRDEG